LLTISEEENNMTQAQETHTSEQQEQAHYHYCESCAAARAGAPVPYDQLDPEVVDLVKALNSVPGMRTLQSCFGHTGSGDPKKAHQDYVFVDLARTDKLLFSHFWRDFFDANYGKPEMSTGYVQFSVVYYPFDPDPNYLIRLMIEVEHDPSIDPRGNQEKKEAMQHLQNFIAKYLETHQEFFEQARAQAQTTTH
jgi:hypothetical protein